MLSERHVFAAPSGCHHGIGGACFTKNRSSLVLAACPRIAPRLAEEVDVMAQILMPKATAVWLVENTTLTFEQVAAFCGLHPLEVQGIADGEVAIGIIGTDPTTNG